MAEYQSLVDRATNVANQPYQPYQGELVAPLTSQTNAGLGGISQYSGAAQPYLGAAGAMTMGASAPVNPSQFMGMGSLSPFMNPYTSSVVDTTQAEMNNQNQQQAQFLNSANISSGAFGGDRAGIGQAVLANQQQLAEAPTIAGLNQANFSQAMQDWTGQQGVNLAAQQANRAAQLSGAAQLGQIGLSAQEAGLQGSQADIQAGMIPQQEQQAIDTAAQQMYQQGQAYPFTTTGWLGNIIEGVGGQSGGTSQTTSPGPNSITQGLGAATQGMGLLTSLMSLSDERAKENIEEIGRTYDDQKIYRYNFRGDPRTQIGLIAQEEAYHDPGSVQRIGMGDLLGIDYERATESAAERGHFADGGAPDQGLPPGGMTQGVTQGAGQPRPPPQSMSPDMSLMYMGDPSARAGMGSFALMGGTNIHPTPETALAQSSVAPPPQVPVGGGGSSLSPLGGHLPSIFPSEPQSQGSGAWRGGRQGRQGGGQAPVGPNAAMGMATPGFQPGLDPLSDIAGVNEALFGEETAGSKNPYTGIDFDQAMAIGGGQWMPPQTGATMPDFGNLQNSPQFGAAESSLAGAFGPGYTPGSTTLGPGGAAPTVPAANAPGGGGFMGAPAMGGIVGGAPSPGAMGAAGATQGGLSRDQLANVFDEYFGGASPAQAAPSPLTTPGHARGGRIGRQIGGPTATLALPINQGPWGVQSGGSGGGTQPAANSGGGGGPWTQMMGTPSAMNPSGNAEVGMANWAGFSGPQGMMEADAEGFRADGGGVNMNGRSGFQRGGSPFTTYQPTANPARNPPTYTALDLSRLFGGGQQQAPRAIQIQRQLGQARAKAAVQRGLVRPRVIAHDPVTGQPHDITPLHDRPPFGSGPYNPGGQPYRPEDDPRPPTGGPLDPTGPTVRFGAKNPFLGPQPKDQEVGPESAGEEPRGPGPTGPEPTPGRAPPPPEESGGWFSQPKPIEGLPAAGDPRSLVPPSIVRQASPVGRAIAIGKQLLSPSATSGPTGVELPRSLGRRPSGPSGAPIAAPPPQSHVTDLGTWEGEGGAPAPAEHHWGPWHAGGTPSGPIIAGPPQSPGPPPADLDDEIMRMGDEGPQLYRGGRIGRADGGDIDTSYGPQQSVIDLTDAQFGSALQDEMRSAPSGSLDWMNDLGKGLPTDSTWNALAPSGGGASPQRIQMNPNAVAQAPSFQGAGGGGGGPHFTQTSLMGGPPISALDLSGHYTPTTGNARGATYVPGAGGISPNARAQAPEHPAIAVARHIAGRAHAAGFAAGHAAGRLSKVDPNMGPIQRASDTSYGPQLPSEYDEYGYGIGAKPTYGKAIPGSEAGGQGTSTGFQGGGGVLGSSPVMNAGGYTPQGEGVTGQTSQGRGMGFGDLFGGGERAGFASGGLPSVSDPFLAEITASMPQASGGGGGHGPPAPPPPAPQPPAGQDPGKGLGDSLGKLGDAVKKFSGQSGGQQTAPDGSRPYLSPADQSQLPGLDFTPADTSAIDAGMSGDLFTGALDPSNFADSAFFATGGGVGLGSLRGGFSDGGTPDASDAPSGFDLAVTGAAAPVAAPTGGGGGGGLATAAMLRDHLMGTYGLTKDQATGFAGTLGYESGDFKTMQEQNPVGGGKGGWGWAQWTGPRRTEFEKFANANGLDPSSPAANQGFLDHELQGKYSGALDEIRKTGSVADAAKATLVHYEGMPDTPEIRAQGGIPATQGHIDRALAYNQALGGANAPSSDAQPAEADTTSYGGGFRLPGQGGPPPGTLDRSNLQAPTMGDELKHDPGGYLMSVGAAMMASRSPWLGVGIGEGFEAGNKYLQQQKELEKGWGTAQAQINQMGAEARDKGADADLKAQQLQMAAMMQKIFVERMRQRGLLGGGSSGTASPGATGGPGQPSGGLTPLTGLGGGKAPSGAPGDPSAPSDSDAAPRIEDDKLYQQAQDLYAQARDAELDDRIMGTHQAEDLRAQAKELSDAAQKNFEKTSAPYTAKIDAQKAGFTEYQKRADEFTGDYQSNVEMLTQLGKIYKSYQSGTGAEDFANVQGLADRLGITLPDGWNTSGKAGYDAAMKTAVDAAFQKMQSSGANKAPRSIMQEALTTSPTPTNDPSANWKIITETLARLKYSKEMMDSVMSSGSLNVTKAENAWMKTHGSLDPYRKEARKNTPLFMGMTPGKYHTVTGSNLETTKDGRTIDRESGKVWDAKGNPLN
jgi:hypothetical protein